MIYYRCKCGKHESWSSMGVPLCQVCEKCGSTLATSPSTHLDPKPHEYVTQYDQDTGKPYEICLQCMRTKDQNEKVGENVDETAKRDTTIQE